jgi:simple sugar transport system substrate-binding protein
MDGTWASADTWGGLKAGMVHMSPYGDAVPDNVRAKADAVREGIMDGSVQPFAGPIYNQQGELVVKEGEVVPDDKLLSMNWFVKGVQGQLPK